MVRIVERRTQMLNKWGDEGRCQQTQYALCKFGESGDAAPKQHLDTAPCVFEEGLGDEEEVPFGFAGFGFDDNGQDLPSVARRPTQQQVHESTQWSRHIGVYAHSW